VGAAIRFEYAGRITEERNGVGWRKIGLRLMKRLAEGGRLPRRGCEVAEVRNSDRRTDQFVSKEKAERYIQYICKL
jgi:hypothetical protein